MVMIRKLPLMRCPDGVVGADAMTTVLRMVGSPPTMMDGPSDRPIVVGKFVHGSSPSRQHLVVDINTWRRRRQRRKIVQGQQTLTLIDNVKVGGRGIISGGCKK